MLFEHPAELAQNVRFIVWPLLFGVRPAPNSNSLKSKTILQTRENMIKPLNRTKTIGIKVSESAYDALRRFAESQGKPLSEWCRDAIIAASKPATARPSDYAVMAEIDAVEAILIDMFLALARGQLNTQKAQEIVDKAHNIKFKEAAELLRYAHSRMTRIGLGGPTAVTRPGGNAPKG